MTQPILSILIPSVVGRLAEWNNLLEKIFQQSGVKREIGYYEGYGNGWMNIWRSNNEVEILSLFDKKQLSIGGKREIMYNEAKGLYSWQIDDDDDISPTAIKLILEAMDKVSADELSRYTKSQEKPGEGIEKPKPKEGEPTLS